MSYSLRRGALLVLLLVASISAQDAWDKTTPGKPGTGGLVPRLRGLGVGTPESGTNSLHLTSARPATHAVFVGGARELAVTFKGGVFGPAPLILHFGFVTDSVGRISLPFALDASVPVGMEVWLQYWILDPGGFVGSSASNTLKLTVHEPAPEPQSNEAWRLFGGARFVNDRCGQLATLDADGDGVLDVVEGLTPLSDRIHVLRGIGDGSVAPRIEYDDDVHTDNSFELCDLNGDGVLDLVGAHWRVGVLLGAADGSFGASQLLYYGHGETYATVADLNDDGALDIVAADQVGELAVVLMGDGSGHFVTLPAIDLPADSNARQPRTGFVDGDAHLDVVIPLGGADAALLRGNGDGTFAAPTTLDLGVSASNVHLADLDADGASDLLFEPAGTGDVAVRLGNGDGSFLPATSYAVGASVGRILLVDLNADGALDLVATDADRDLPGASLAVLLGDGAGGFGAAAYAFGARRPRAVAAGDLDADGFLDLVVAKGTSGNAVGYDVGVLRGRGDGSFTPVWSVDDQPQAVEAVAGDFDGDGFGDVAIAYDGSPLSSVSIALGIAHDVLGLPQAILVGGTPRGLAVGDVTGDGLADVVALTVPDNQLSVISVLGDGSLGVVAVVHAGSGAWQPIVADLNGDDALDIVVAVSGTILGQSGMRVFLGDGEGGLLPSQLWDLGFSCDRLQLADIDGNGTLDALLYSQSSPTLLVAFGAGNGTFVAGPQTTLPGGMADALLGDWSGDGLVDLVVVPEVSSTFALLEGQGDGSFVPAGSVMVGSDTYQDEPVSAALEDLDGDGLADLIATQVFRDEFVVNLSLGSGAFGSSQRFRSGREVRHIAIHDVDGNGSADLVITLTNGGGVLVFPNQLGN